MGPMIMIEEDVTEGVTEDATEVVDEGHLPHTENVTTTGTAQDQDHIHHVSLQSVLIQGDLNIQFMVKFLIESCFLW